MIEVITALKLVEATIGSEQKYMLHTQHILLNALQHDGPLTAGAGGPTGVARVIATRVATAVRIAVTRILNEIAGGK
jgi:hypothetical protein